MDFVEGVPRSGGFNTILVVVDRLRKYAYFIAATHPYFAKMIAAAFIKEVVCHHGFSSSIMSNQDKIFISCFWIELFRLQGNQLKRSITYHPQRMGRLKS